MPVEIRSKYEQWQTETEAAFSKCKSDIKRIADYLLESKYNDLIAQYESSYDKELNNKFLFETLKIFTYTNLLTYNTNDCIRNGVIRYIKIILQSNKIFQREHDEILSHCITYFDNFTSPILYDYPETLKLFMEILTLDDADSYKARLLTNCDLVFSSPLDAVNLRILIYSVIGEYEQQVIIPRQDEEIKRNREKQEQIQKAEQARIKALDPNKNAECWNVNSFFDGQLFEGKNYQSNCIKNILNKETGKPIKPLSGGSMQGQFKQLERLVDFTKNDQTKIIEIFGTHELEDKIDGRSRTKGAYRIPLKAIILLKLMQSDNLEISMSEGSFWKSIMQHSLSLYFNNVPKGYYYSVMPDIDKKDIDFVLNDTRQAIMNNFRRNAKSTLDELANSGLIKVEYRYIAVEITEYGESHLSRNEDPNLVKNILEAEKYAMNQIVFYDKKSGRYRTPHNKYELYKHHKWDEFNNNYNQYINEKFSWDRTYREIYYTALNYDDIEDYLKEIQYNPNEYSINQFILDFYTELNNVTQTSILKRESDRRSAYLNQKEIAPLKKSDYDAQYYIQTGVESNISSSVFISSPIIPDDSVEITRRIIESEIQRDNDSRKNDIDAWKQKEKKLFREKR